MVCFVLQMLISQLELLTLSSRHRGLGGAKERLCSCACIYKPWPVLGMDAADGLENTILGWRHSWRHRVEETTCRCFWVDEPTWCVTVGGAIQEEAIQQFA